uniref:Uncharacterized protein n=1 Tax=Acrobeloides nanus TaxID=290746 RepID=A0A914E8T6_9BILA
MRPLSFVSSIWVFFILLVVSLNCIQSTSLYAAPSYPDVYLRFRKNAGQDNIQPFIRFRRSEKEQQLRQAFDENMRQMEQLYGHQIQN